MENINNPNKLNNSNKLNAIPPSCETICAVMFHHLLRHARRDFEQERNKPGASHSELIGRSFREVSREAKPEDDKDS